MTGGNRDGAARAQQFVGDLNAGRRGADDQHAAFVEIVRSPVAGRHDLADAPREAGRGAGNMWNVAVSRGDDGPAREPCAAVGDDAVPVCRRRQFRDRRVAFDGRLER